MCYQLDKRGFDAILKARHAARATGMPALGDDSGLCVDALHGAPGLYSARYAGAHGNDEANIDKLLHELDGVDDARRGARFVCVLALVRDAHDHIREFPGGKMQITDVDGNEFEIADLDRLPGKGIADLYRLL